MEKFSTVLRGYKKEEVNRFVDDVIKQVESMLSELKAKDLELNNLRLNLEKYQNMETALNKAIILAEDTSSQIKKMAKDEYESIIKDAKRNASKIVNDALIEAERTQMQSIILKRNIITFKKRLKSMLENQLQFVDDIDKID